MMKGWRIVVAAGCLAPVLAVSSSPKDSNQGAATPAATSAGAPAASLTDYVLAHRAEFIAITPPEIKSDVELEVQYWQAVKDAGYDMQTAKAPAGFAEPAKRITQYGQTACGIS